MSLFIGRDNSGRGIIHLSRFDRSSTELKSGLLNDTIFHNDMLYYTYTLYPVTGVYYSRDDVGTKYAVADNNVRVDLKLLDLSLECINSIVDSYLPNSTTIVMYLNSAKVETDMPVNKLAFVKYNGNIYNWSSRSNYTVSYRPIPENSYYNCIQPCIWNGNGYDISYVVIFRPVYTLGGTGVYIKPSTGQFNVGGTNLYNFKFVVLNSISIPGASKINSKMSLVDTAELGGQLSLSMTNTENSIKLNGYSIFSDVTSLYGLNNFVSTYVNITYARLLYTNNLLLSGLSSGDLVYIKLAAEGDGNAWSSWINGFTVYSEGKQLLIRDTANSHLWLLCSGGNIYARTTSSSGGTYSFFFKYGIFK